MQALLLEDPDDQLLDRWQIEHLPTWLRFIPAGEAGQQGADAQQAVDAQEGADVHGAGPETKPGPAPDRLSTAGSPKGGDDSSQPTDPTDPLQLADPTASAIVDELSGRSPGGREIVLPGPWRLTHRRSGALPKHVVDAELGPDAG